MSRRTIAMAVVAGVIVTALAVGPLMDAFKGSATSSAALFRANLARTGVYPGPGVFDFTGIKWRFETDASVSSSPAIARGVVYVGSSDGHVYALDAETGEERWRFETGDPVRSSPAVTDSTVYVGSSDQHLYAVNAETGEERWRFTTDGSVGSSPAVADGVVYLVSGHHLYAVDAETGEEHWSFEADGQGGSGPALVGGVVYFTAHDLYAVNAKSGEQRWRFETDRGLDTTPAVEGGIVYVGSRDHNLYAVNAETGRERWRFEADGSIWSSPAVAGGMIYVGSYDNYLYAVDAETGKQRWRVETGGRITSSPAIVGAVVYVGSHDFHVYAVDAETGEQLWRFRTERPVNSSPAVANGVVYIGSVDGSLYALQGVVDVVDPAQLVEAPEALLNKELVLRDVQVGLDISRALVAIKLDGENLYPVLRDPVIRDERVRAVSGGEELTVYGKIHPLNDSIRAEWVRRGLVHPVNENAIPKTENFVLADSLIGVAGRKSQRRADLGRSPESDRRPRPEEPTSADAKPRIEVSSGQPVDPIRLLEMPQTLMGKDVVLRDVRVARDAGLATLLIELDGGARYPVVRRPVLQVIRRDEFTSSEVAPIGERITVYGGIYPLNDSIIRMLNDGFALSPQYARSVRKFDSYMLSDSVIYGGRTLKHNNISD